MAYETKSAIRREKLKEALIDAAERTIDSEGLRGLKARELAQEVGCAVGAIYNVVSDLDDLVFAVNARTLATLEKKIAASERAPDSPVDRLVRLALAYTDFAAAHRLRWRAIFDHRPLAGREIPEWYAADQRRLFAYVEGPLEALRPGIAADERALLARSLFSAVHGIVVLGLEEKLQLIPLPVLREQVKILVSALGRGLAQTQK